MALPEVQLDVAFATNPTDAVQTWTNVSSDATGRQLEFSVKSGRQDELKDVEVGVLTCTLRNQDRRFDPSYSLSPYYPNVLPVKQARLRAIYSATTYDLFRGDIEQWPQVWEQRTNTASISALDALDPLSDAEISLDRPAETTGARLGAVLDAAGWPAGQRSIDAGQTTLQAVTAWSGSALELLRQIVFDEDGYIYVDGTGAIVFLNRHKRLQSPYNVPQVTLSNRPSGAELPFADVDVQQDKDFIKNYIQLTQDTSNIVTVRSDATSQAAYRLRTLKKDTYIQSVNDIASKCEWLLGRLKDPIVRARSVVIEPQSNDSLWAHALGRKIGDLITVKVYPPQTGTEEAETFNCHIEYIEHRYVVGRWQTKWYLSPGSVNSYWLLGDSSLGVLGSTTRLAY